MNGNKATAHRIEAAKTNFDEIIMNITGCKRKTAIKVTGYYLKHKIAKLDPVVGKINVKHGAFLDEDTLRNAISAVL